MLSVMRGKRGVWPALLRLLMAILAVVYCGALTLYLLPYRIGIRKRTRLKSPVISIGNLTTGGTGKTPFTIMLCRALQSIGKSVVVLNRGYRGKNEFSCALVSDKNAVLMNAEDAGDEAFLLAQSLPGIPVLAGKDRRSTGAKATELFHPDIVILDDGLQFWQLHRDLDIVLLSAVSPFDNGWTLPRGLLREPPSHLQRADIIVITNSSSCNSAEISALQNQIQSLAPDRPHYFADIVPRFLKNLTDGAEMPVSWLRDRKAAVFSALGNPESFEHTVKLLGAEILKISRFRDHEKLSEADLNRICLEASQAGAETIVTTSKDAVKLGQIQSSVPVLALHVEMEVNDLSALLQKVLSKVDFKNE